MSGSIEEIRHNAQRLWEDAKLLFDHKRYASALALTVLSLEETGKYALLSGRVQFDGPDKNLRNHLTRQSAVFDLMVQQIGVELAIEVLAERGLKIVRETEEIRAAANQRFGEPTPERRAFVAQIWNEYLDMIKKASPLYQNVKGGDLNVLKMASLYVDVQEDGTTLVVHPKITRKVAEALLITAERLLLWSGKDPKGDAICLPREPSS
jgi:AbiV family abortive infection protein